MNRREQERQSSEKAKYFVIWMRYAATLMLTKSEQVECIQYHTGKSTIKECDAADLRKLLIGLGLDPDGQGATA